MSSNCLMTVMTVYVFLKYPDNLAEMTSEVTTQDLKNNAESFFKKRKRSLENKMLM